MEGHRDATGTEQNLSPVCKIRDGSVVSQLCGEKKCCWLFPHSSQNSKKKNNLNPL